MLCSCGYVSIGVCYIYIYIYIYMYKCISEYIGVYMGMGLYVFKYYAHISKYLYEYHCTQSHTGNVLCLLI